MRRRAWGCGIAIAALACGGRSSLELAASAQSGVGAGGGSTADTTSVSGPGGSGNGGDGGSSSNAGGFGGTGGAAGAGNGIIGYAQSRTQLYALGDGMTPMLIGDLDGCYGDALDVAIDETGMLFVSTPAGIYRVDSSNASCSLIAEGIYPNGLTVTPPGIIEPNDSALVGIHDDTYERIDRASGAVSVLGALGSRELYSSGDLVLHAGRMYLAAAGGTCFDCLAEVDRETGTLLQVVGPIGFRKVFGLLSFDGTLYGFTNAGEVLTIDPFTGAGTLVNEFPIEFWGATRYP